MLAVNLSIHEKVNALIQGPAPPTFFDRLNLIAAGRDLSAWAQNYGWNVMDVTRARKGHVPGWKKLAPLARGEGVSLSWLVDGIGPSHIDAGAWSSRELPPPPPSDRRSKALIDAAQKMTDEEAAALAAFLKTVTRRPAP